ncbi:hypothetical protein FRC17_003155 [Serendipita sp. 399]|nr:hypothetical protein FRC17_003155 [Serendipita sp. 399]
MLRGQITPHSSQIHMYDQERNSYVTRLMWLPRCRYLWDGRTGIFSRTWLGPCVCKLLVIDVATKDKASIETKVEDGVTYTVRHANQLLRRSIEEMSRLGGGGDVWTVGIFFKAMAWLEHAPSDDSPGRDGVKIRFVEFPPSTDRMPHSSATGSSFPGPADLDRKGGNAAQTVPITLDVEDLLDNGVLHPDSNDEFHRRLGEVVASNEHGHICEYELPPDWLARYKGTSSMDYDDARGRVAFVTGKRSERLIIYEIV